MKSDQYLTQTRNLLPLHFSHIWAYGPVRYARKFIPITWKEILTTKYKNQAGWHYQMKNLEDVGTQTIKYFQNPANLKKFAKQMRTLGARNLDLAEKIQQDLKKFSTQRKKQVAELYFKLFTDFAALTQTFDATDVVLEKLVNQEFQKLTPQLSSEEISTLLTTANPSYVQKEAKAFRELVIKYRKEKKQRLLENYVSEWWWKTLAWGYFEIFSLGELKKAIKNAATSKYLIEKNTQETRDRAKALTAKRKLLKKLPLDLRKLLNIYDVLAELHDYRKEVQMKTMYSGILLCNQILERAKIPGFYQHFMFPKEIISVLDGDFISRRELNRRKLSYLYSVKKDRIKFLSGNQALKEIQLYGFFASRFLNTEIIHGIIACSGRTKGRVKIGNEPKVINSTMKKGEILVTTMTAPEFIPAIKKAAAIIADEGGITCHAAIISRELNIPCIVNTKIATKVLKDGDLVEVDADKGVVRILEK